MHAVFLVSTESGQRDEDGEEDLSLLYAYPSNPPAGSTGSYVKCFSSLIVTVRGAMDSICGEKTKTVYLDHGGGRLLLASAHLESVVLVLAVRAVVPPSLASSLAVGLAESLVLLLGPFAGWGLGRAGSPGQADTGHQQCRQQQEAETRAILDRVFEGALSQIHFPGWATRMAPWNSFESSCLHLALPAPLHQRLGALVADHAAQRQRAPFSFFRKHSCLMYRGLLLASDLHPLHARQLWQLLWALGVMHHSGLPCQVLTRIVHLPQPPPAAPPAAATSAAVAGYGGGAAAGRAAGPGAAAGGAGGGTSGAGGGAAAATAAAAAAAALQAEAGVTVSEQPMGRSLLVVVSALKFVLAVVLTAYDEEIEEELAGRLEGHAAAELLQRIHASLGPDLERLVEASAVYSSAAHFVDSPPPPPSPPEAPTRSPLTLTAAGAGAAKSAGGPPVGSGSGGSLLFRALTRNRSTPRRGPAPGGSILEAPFAAARSTPTSPTAKSPFRSGASVPLLPPGPPANSLTTQQQQQQQQQQHPNGTPRSPGTGGSGGGSSGGFGATPPAGQQHDRSQRGSAPPQPQPQPLPGLPPTPPPPIPLPPAVPPVPAPEGALLLIVHDAPQGCVRFLGDLPCGPGPAVGGGGGAAAAAALAAVWRAVAACRARFGLHNVAVAAPPKHARLTMTLDQIQQLSAARSQKSGGQRLGAADSSPWQYHPELASLAAVSTITLRLPGLRLLPNGTVWAAGAPTAGAGGGGGGATGSTNAGSGAAAEGAGQCTTPSATPAAKSWLGRMSGSRRGSRPGTPDAGGAGSGTPRGDLPTTPQSAVFAATPFAGDGGGAAAAAAAGTIGGRGGSCSSPPYTVTAGAGSGSAGPAATAAAGAVYLTAVLFPDTREVYVCHGADLDDGRLAEAMWDGSVGAGELWVRESMAVAS